MNPPLTPVLSEPPAELDRLRRRAADTIRCLAMDAVQKANSGHPGLPMGMADAAVVLWSQFLKHDPAEPAWPDRDRFVLSAGHGSMLLYSLLHLTGYDLPLDELKAFRQWESRTPGHPEHGLTAGVETTTGPLGQGIGNAVGMALAERWLAARFNRPGFDVVDHHTWVIASDGDLMEGVSHESCALAGHLGLGRLIVLWDDNGISIDGPTSLSFSENVLARFDGYGWHTARVDGHDGRAVAAALEAAQRDHARPSIIACRTTIGFGSPNRQGTSKAHGEPLGVEEVRLTKRALGWPEDHFFEVPPDVPAFLRRGAAAGAARREAWTSLLDRYRGAHPDLATQFARTLQAELPDGWDAGMPAFPPDKPIATRAASGAVIAALVPHVPGLLGGSADLTPSNNTLPKGAPPLRRDDLGGQYIHFGVREHGMASLMNGMALHGGIRPYGGTFLVFSDYMRPAIRLAALMGIPVIYVFTHDSIGLGEDGPTHQPVEQIASLRAIPNLVVFRPADATETVVAWRSALQRRDGPTALMLTRQALPVLQADTAQAARGAYVVWESGTPAVILIGTGSELHIALEAGQRLASEGLGVRVVSMPSQEIFEAQPPEYREQILPSRVTARVAIEAAVPFGWDRYVGFHGRVIGLKRFGASAPYQTLYRGLGLTADAVIDAARQVVAGHPGAGPQAPARS